MCKRKTAHDYYWQMEHEDKLAQVMVFTDEIVLIADNKENLHQAGTEWEAELERKGMTFNVRKSKLMQIGLEQENIEILCKGEPIEMVDKYTYLGTVISRNGKVDQEISNRIKKANAIYYHLCNTVVGKREVEKNVKVHIFKAIYLPTLLYGSESWVPLDKHLSRVTRMEMRYLRRVADLTRRDRIRNERTRCWNYLHKGYH
ncbi:uncharacterized protein [Halyomorpha halys]|uniref:uncharacterized protein n=1 Tax=Halyomorpha halys TaxID=286706 RepID=UPI0006D505F3|nr:uncharacterized protein LOC106692941 [Halyomorpha halys]